MVRGEPAPLRAKVLIVEDDATLTLLLRYNLEAAGYDVTWVDNGRDVRGAIIDEAPDLLLLDWGLPLISGIELLRQIRAAPTTCMLPVLMLTARGAPDDRARAMATGADAFIAKPFALHDVLSKLDAMARSLAHDGTGRRVRGGA